MLTKKIDKLIKDLEDFEKNQGNIISNTFKNNENIINDMIANKQLFKKGETGEGVEIDSYAPYKPFTVMEKIRNMWLTQI